MASVRFYLEKRKDKLSGEVRETGVPILMFFSFDGNRLQINTGEKTDLKNWDVSKMRVKSGPDKIGINNELDSQKDKVTKIYREGKIMGDAITPDYIRDKFYPKSKSSDKSFFEIYEEYLEFGKDSKTKGTLKKYRSVVNHLKAFEQKSKSKITFDHIDYDFLEKFVRFLLADLGHSNNTIAKNIKNIKAFLNYAVLKGYNKSLKFKDFKAKEEEGEVIFLDWHELIQLYNCNLPLKSLDQVRDVFVFGCLTGMRYSDINNLKLENIKADFIELKTIKNRDTTSVPLNTYTKAILNKYKDSTRIKALPVVSNQKMNDYLKEVGKIAGLDEQIQKVIYKGAQRIEESYKKYELLTTHVARKTFITLSLMEGVPAEVIMSITTHRTHQSFKKYYKIVDRHKKGQMDKVFTNKLDI